MHTFLLVAGDKLDEQLLLFSHHFEVKPYESFLSDEDIQGMADFYKIPPTELDALVAMMPDWENTEGFIRNGRLGFISSRNPKGRHDGYQVGGRWLNALPLLQPRQLPRFFGLLPAKDTINATSAKKCEIDLQALLATPPAALLFQGEWFESPIVLDAEGEGETLTKWQTEFACHFCKIPDHTMLTVVDVHS